MFAGGMPGRAPRRSMALTGWQSGRKISSGRRASPLSSRPSSPGFLRLPTRVNVARRRGGFQAARRPKAGRAPG
eukprot:10608830-Lingulodinium_polyedra.AAC.1